MNPVAAQRVSVTTADGLSLATTQIGPETADLTVILLHGLMGDSGSWQRQTSHLTSSHTDIRIIAYDQRGHGRSGRGCTRSNTLGQLARDLDAVIDATAASGQIVLIGHSMGAMTILQYLQHQQARNVDRIAGVGLIAPAVADITRYGLGRVLATPLLAKACALASRIPASAEAIRTTAVRATAPIWRPVTKNAPTLAALINAPATANSGRLPRIDLQLRRDISLPNPQRHTNARHVRNQGYGHATSPFGRHLRRGPCSGVRRCPRHAHPVSIEISSDDLALVAFSSRGEISPLQPRGDLVPITFGSWRAAPGAA